MCTSLPQATTLISKGLATKYISPSRKHGYKFVHTPLPIQDPPGHYFDVGSDRGMNEKGFSWTRAWVVPNEPEAANKMSAVDWFLKMGSTVATVDEAIKFVQDNPKGHRRPGQLHLRRR